MNCFTNFNRFAIPLIATTLKSTPNCMVGLLSDITTFDIAVLHCERSCTNESVLFISDILLYSLVIQQQVILLQCESPLSHKSKFSQMRPFFAFHTPFFALGVAFMQKVKGFRGLFFHCINKIQNLHEIRKVYIQCFVYRGVFRKNIREITVKCEIRKVYSRPKRILQFFREFHETFK